MVSTSAYVVRNKLLSKKATNLDIMIKHKLRKSGRPTTRFD